MTKQDEGGHHHHHHHKDAEHHHHKKGEHHHHHHDEEKHHHHHHHEHEGGNHHHHHHEHDKSHHHHHHEHEHDNKKDGSHSLSHPHSHSHGGHGHTHEKMDDPGSYDEREKPLQRNYIDRAFTVGVGGPVGSGKTALVYALCKTLRHHYSIAAITNDIFTQEDGEFLLRHSALEPERIKAIETGGCPHAAIREDISANLSACEEMTAKNNADIILVESGGDNLAANFSRELADYIIYVIDVAGGDKVPRKGGPGITQSDLLVINKTDLADAVGADLDRMKREAAVMRGDGPVIFAQVKFDHGVSDIKKLIVDAWKVATGIIREPKKRKEGAGTEESKEHKKLEGEPVEKKEKTVV